MRGIPSHGLFFSLKGVRLVAGSGGRRAVVGERRERV